MSLKEKLGGLFRREKTPLGSDSLEKAKRDVQELTRRLAEISENRSREEANLREIARKASGLQKGSAEYQLAGVRYGNVKKKIDALDEQFKVAAKLLVTNQSFATTLESGEAMKALMSYVQDPARVGVILDEVKRSTQDIADKVDLFAGAVSEFDQGMSSLDFDMDNSEFDALVDEMTGAPAASSARSASAAEASGNTALNAEVDALLREEAAADAAKDAPAESGTI